MKLVVWSSGAPVVKYRSRTGHPALEPDLWLCHRVGVAGKQQGVVFCSSQAADASRRRRLHFEFAKPRQENGIHIPARVTEVGRGTPGQFFKNAPVIDPLATKSRFVPERPLTMCEADRRSL